MNAMNHRYTAFPTDQIVPQTKLALSNKEGLRIKFQGRAKRQLLAHARAQEVL
jgi:hypothetical protein